MLSAIPLVRWFRYFFFYFFYWLSRWMSELFLYFGFVMWVRVEIGVVDFGKFRTW